MQKTVVLRKNKDMVSRVIEGETILLPLYKSSDEINCIYIGMDDDRDTGKLCGPAP